MTMLHPWLKGQDRSGDRRRATSAVCPSTSHGMKSSSSRRARRGVEQLYEAFCSVGLSLEDFEGERFKRIAHVKKLIRNGELDEDLRRVSAPAMAVAV